MSKPMDPTKWLRRTVVLGAAAAASGMAVASAAPGAGVAMATIPSARLARSGTREWRLTGRTRIVADACWLAQAERLAAELVSLGLLRSRPAIAAHGATSDDIRLVRRRSAHPEGYGITTGRHGPVTLEAGTDAGLYYASRTLLQSLVAAGSMPSGVIVDHPDRPERGVTVDVGRKFYSKDWLRRLIAQMGWLKLNTLHLHLNDNEGFGYASASYPQLASQQHLTLDDLRELVSFAARHHVAIVPELDSPGHMASILKHFPQFALRASDGSSQGRAIDVSMAGARSLVRALIDELLPVFPGARWHLGGDEVLLTEKPDASSAQLDAWFPQLVSYAERRAGPGATAHDAITLYLNDLHTYLASHGKRTRAWNDGMQSSGVVAIDPRIEVDYWENLGGKLKTAEQHLAEGHRLINAHSRFLYYVVAEPPLPWYPRPALELLYAQWRVEQFEGQAPLKAAGPALLGGHLSVWADRPNDRSEAQIAADIRGPLCALAQKTWRDGTPPLALPAFAALTQAVGPGLP